MIEPSEVPDLGFDNESCVVIEPGDAHDQLDVLISLAHLGDLAVELINEVLALLEERGSGGSNEQLRHSVEGRFQFAGILGGDGPLNRRIDDAVELIQVEFYYRSPASATAHRARQSWPWSTYSISRVQYLAELRIFFKVGLPKAHESSVRAPRLSLHGPFASVGVPSRLTAEEELQQQFTVHSGQFGSSKETKRPNP